MVIRVSNLVAILTNFISQHMKKTGYDYETLIHIELSNLSGICELLKPF